LTCPVRTVTAYLHALAENGLTTGPLLRSVTRHGHLAGTPGAAGRGTGRMSGAGINLVIKNLAEQAGIEGITAHSLRAGPATAAAAAGAPRAWIARQGRWCAKSTAVDSYIRPAHAWRDNPMRRVAPYRAAPPAPSLPGRPHGPSGAHVADHTDTRVFSRLWASERCDCTPPRAHLARGGVAVSTACRGCVEHHGNPLLANRPTPVAGTSR